MQKVGKELLTELQNGQIQLHQVDDANVSKWNLSSLDSLLKCFKIRENKQLSELAGSMQSGISQGKSIFEVWMKDQSDLIQVCAKIFVLS